MSALFRVRSARAPYRRAGIEFGSLPLVLGPEHFEQGVAGLTQLAAILSDPVLTVKVSDHDAPDVFRDLTDDEREAIVEAAKAAAEHDDPEAAEAAAGVILEGFVGVVEPPVDPAEQDRAKRLAEKMAAEKAEEDRIAAEKVAADAKAEADRIAAEKTAADAKAEEDRVAAEKIAADAKAEEDRIAAEKVAADAKDQASKGEPAPSQAKAEAVAKPARSSGRKSAAAVTTGAKD